MEQKILPSISIGREGRLVVGGAVITQKSPLYDGLANPVYLNPRAFAGAALMNERFGQGAAEKFADAIANTAIRIRAEQPKAAPGACLNKAISKSISDELGAGGDARNIGGSRNAPILALFDVYCILNMKAALSVGQNYDIALEVGGSFFAYPDDQSGYRGNAREERYVATTPAQACSAVHLVLGSEAEKRAQDRKRAGDRIAWKTEITEAARHYEEAAAFDIGNDAAIFNLSGAYARTGQHGKASDIYRKAFELSPKKGAKAYYSSFLAESAICTKDARRMIGALRAIEVEFPGGNTRLPDGHGPQYVQVREAVEDLRSALAGILRL